MKFEKESLFLLLAVAAALVIFVTRRQDRGHEVLRMEDRRMVLDEGAFLRDVVARIPSARATMTRLLVFVNPSIDCPASIYEHPQWTAPLEHIQGWEYGITLLFPEALPRHEAEAFLKATGLTIENAFFYPPAGPMAHYRRFGPLMVFFSQEGGVLWVGPIHGSGGDLGAKIKENIKSLP